MLFARRRKPSLSERLRVAVWPRRSFRRSARYVGLRLIRLQASPHRIALGAAAGIFAAITPFLGAQMALAALLAAMLGGSKRAAVLGTFIGNPLSWPAIWVGTYGLGRAMMGADVAAHADELQHIQHHLDVIGAAMRDGSVERLEEAANLAAPVFVPMAAGSLPVGLALAVLFYWGLRRAVAASRVRRAALFARG